MLAHTGWVAVNATERARVAEMTDSEIYEHGYAAAFVRHAPGKAPHSHSPEAHGLSRRSRRNPTERRIRMSPALIARLSQWHSGMDAVYALTSTAYAGHRGHAVPEITLDMIDKALTVLGRVETDRVATIEGFRKMKYFPEQKRWIREASSGLKHLRTTISQLQNVYDRHAK